MNQNLTSVDTSRITAAERPGYGARARSGLCGDLQQAHSFGDKAIECDHDPGSFGRRRLCRNEVNSQRAALPAAWPGFVPHDVVKILFQTQGTSLFEQDGNQITLVPGDCLAYDVSPPHAITSPALTSCEVVIIPKNLLLQRGIPLENLQVRWMSARTSVARQVHEFLVSTIKEIRALSLDSQLGVGEALLDILLPLFCVSNGSEGDISAPKVLQKCVKLYARVHLHDPDLNIDKISTALKCSKRYVHMSFKGEEASVSKYIWQARLEQCRKELETAKVTGKSVTEIAFSWGFCSSSHFCRLFKEKYGIPASAIQHG